MFSGIRFTHLKGRQFLFFLDDDVICGFPYIICLASHTYVYLNQKTTSLRKRNKKEELTFSFRKCFRFFNVLKISLMLLAKLLKRKNVFLWNLFTFYYTIKCGFFVYINGIVAGTARKLHNPQTCVHEIDL